jgi:hypothetical protein
MFESLSKLKSFALAEAEYKNKQQSPFDLQKTFKGLESK